MENSTASGPLAQEQCAKCGFTHETVRKGLCYSCKQQANGRSGWERHHLFGKALPYTVKVPGNVHRVLTDKQREWSDVVRNPHNPLEILALAFVAVGDILGALSRLLSRLSDWLIAADQMLMEAYGQSWSDEIAPLWRSE